jgi:hypothetical protein
MFPHFLNRLTDVGEIVSFTLRSLFTPRKILLKAESISAIVRLEGLGQLKNPVTSSGIEPATFRLVS